MTSAADVVSQTVHVRPRSTAFVRYAYLGCSYFVRIDHAIKRHCNGKHVCKTIDIRLIIFRRFSQSPHADIRTNDGLSYITNCLWNYLCRYQAWVVRIAFLYSRQTRWEWVIIPLGTWAILTRWAVAGYFQICGWNHTEMFIFFVHPKKPCVRRILISLTLTFHVFFFFCFDYFTLIW